MNVAVKNVVFGGEVRAVVLFDCVRHANWNRIVSRLLKSAGIGVDVSRCIIFRYLNTVVV